MTRVTHAGWGHRCWLARNRDGKSGCASGD